MAKSSQTHFILEWHPWPHFFPHNGSFYEGQPTHSVEKMAKGIFWLGNVLRTTTAYTFSTSQLPKVVLDWCVLYLLTWTGASRHNGVQFFISHLVRWLRTRRFSQPAFRPAGATNHWKKHNDLRLSYLFAHLHLLSSRSFSSLIFSLLLFSSLTLSASAFPFVQIVVSLTSKLPSIINDYWIFLSLNNTSRKVKKCQNPFNL